MCCGLGNYEVWHLGGLVSTALELYQFSQVPESHEKFDVLRNRQISSHPQLSWYGVKGIMLMLYPHDSQYNLQGYTDIANRKRQD